MSQSQYLAVMVSISRDRRLNVTVARHAENSVDEGLLLARLQTWSQTEMESFIGKLAEGKEEVLGPLLSQLAQQLSEPETQEV